MKGSKGTVGLWTSMSASKSLHARKFASGQAAMQGSLDGYVQSVKDPCLPVTYV